MTPESLGQFVVKRAFRVGEVTRQDAVRAAGLSLSTATRLLAAALRDYDRYLRREGYRVRPQPLAEPPAFASEAALLDDLDVGHDAPVVTGLFADELPVVRVRWVTSLPPKRGVLSRLTAAIVAHRQLRLLYLGLREREAPHWRHVLPMALELMGDQWRLIAFEPDKAASRDPGVRTFVLSRILDAEAAPQRRLRGKLPPERHRDAKVHRRVALDPRYSPVQRQLIERELQISDGAVTIPARSEFEFRRRFSHQAVSAEVIWPPLLSVA
jgi:hypothetical protein